MEVKHGENNWLTLPKLLRAGVQRNFPIIPVSPHWSCYWQILFLLSFRSSAVFLLLRVEASVLRSKTNDRFIFLVRCVRFLDSFALSCSSEDIFQFLPRQDRTHSQLATGSISVSFYSEQARCTWIFFCPWETKQILNLSQISHRPKGNTAERPFVMIPTIISLRCIRTKLV